MRSSRKSRTCLSRVGTGHDLPVGGVVIEPRDESWRVEAVSDFPDVIGGPYPPDERAPSRRRERHEAVVRPLVICRADDFAVEMRRLQQNRFLRATSRVRPVRHASHIGVVAVECLGSARREVAEGTNVQPEI
jgi:hypothetical protein